MPARRPPEQTARLRAELLGHAQSIVRRNGPEALTIRALAIEAGCAVGLPYKVFDDREEIVTELVAIELGELVTAFAEWLTDSTQHSVAENLDRYAEVILGSTVSSLVRSVTVDQDRLNARLEDATRDSGFVAILDTAVSDYLRLEQERGRVRADVDPDAFGFLITGAVHNLVVAGDAYPRPSRAELTRVLSAVAATIAGAPRRSAAE